MARRRRALGPKRETEIAFDWNKMSHEIRMIILQEGNGIIGELAQRIAQEMKDLAPTLPANEYVRGPDKRYGTDKSGPLKERIFAAPSDKVPASWVACSPAWYSHFVEYGTEPHFITPKKINQSGRLKWRDPNTGRWYKYKWVANPGIRSVRKPFLRPAKDKAEQFLQEILQRRHP